MICFSSCSSGALADSITRDVARKGPADVLLMGNTQEPLDELDQRGCFSSLHPCDLKTTGSEKLNRDQRSELGLQRQ